MAFKCVHILMNRLFFTIFYLICRYLCVAQDHEIIFYLANIFVRFSAPFYRPQLI